MWAFSERSHGAQVDFFRNVHSVESHPEKALVQRRDSVRRSTLNIIQRYMVIACNPPGAASPHLNEVRVTERNLKDLVCDFRIYSHTFVLCWFH